MIRLRQILQASTTFVHEHRDEIQEASIAFLSVMVSAWFYWALFFVFTFFLTISDSYIDIFFRVSSIALLPSLYAASQAWYHTPRRIYPEHPADTAQSTTPTDEFVI